MNITYSIIIPVYNRPEEINELLHSLTNQNFKDPFEVIVIEDGSTKKCEIIVEGFKDRLNVVYLYKENSGPGLSRNYGMERTKGSYYIILDSDVILPEDYLTHINDALQNTFTDAFGGSDKAHHSFTKIQKAINYAMTSFLTTGGLRNNKGARNKFQLRSFNMGVSKEVFSKTKGFARQHYGEDIDLTFRIWENGFTTQFIPKAFVYHKRRTNFKQFYKQTFNFGAARPILNKKHQNSAKITYWFPSMFVLGLVLSIILLFFNNYYLILFYGMYLFLICVDSVIKNKNLLTGLFSVVAALTQFLGYGMGFLRSQILLNLVRKPKEEVFPKMFDF